ncbi:hypothetical protein A2Y99_02265 [Candidatus Gottesmanbacteria bacterium RBG_13_37_7]|uniref:Glycosyltransferase 2-like domain-containing protein n=1 Tax=Candidatus Gottesmanbacteria bacterium RBG_13_37_7 TaxID=1798369 RepID=A0A1F5YHA6_9BACT|nr:MAG: hypothetical protein A2Y99_02265 [Candidatus Gottesmanbacteria bacterium RBG_13_37_7]
MVNTAVIVLHYQNNKDTLQCLSSLTHQGKKPDYSIIMVDNSACPEFDSEVKNRYPFIHIISNRNMGYAAGNNLGIKGGLKLKCEYFVFLNNDTIVTSHLIQKMVSFCESDSNIGVISPKIYFAPNFEFHHDRYKNEERGKVIWYAGGIIDWKNIFISHLGMDEVDYGQYENSLDTDFATGCCMLVRKKIIDRIGLFDERYFLYFEDVDYSLRVKKAGFRVMYFPHGFLWHKNASSSGKPGSDIHLYYQTRNRLMFGVKYASWRTKKSLIIESLKYLLGNSIKSKAVRDYYFARFGKGTI